MLWCFTESGGLEVDTGLNVNMKIVEGIVRVMYPEGGIKVYNVGMLGHSVQEL